MEGSPFAAADGSRATSPPIVAAFVGNHQFPAHPVSGERGLRDHHHHDRAFPHLTDGATGGHRGVAYMGVEPHVGSRATQRPCEPLAECVVVCTVAEINLDL